MSGYLECFEAAGATVISHWTEDDYCGGSIAKVRVGENVGFVRWDFGSCSGCDAYESFASDCDDYAPTAAQKAEFGAGYLASIMTYDEALAEVTKASEFYGYGDEDDESLSPEENAELRKSPEMRWLIENKP